jgi:hypothetical protein
VRLPPRSLGQLQPGESPEVVVNEEQVEVVLRALDVGHGVSLTRTGLDVPSGELQHIADGL